jgi:Family of unknown function (DUF5317)
MSLLSAIVLGIALGLLTGGRPGNLARIRLRWNALILLSFALQLLLFTGLSIPAAIVTIGYLASGLLSLTWLGRNLQIPGLACVLIGGLSNFAAIAANGGRMPVDPSLLARTRGAEYIRDLAAGRVTSNSSLADNHTRLPWLTDQILIPPPWPLPTVLSVGDLMIAVGVIWVIAAAMRGPAAASTRTGEVDPRSEAKAS